MNSPQYCVLHFIDCELFRNHEKPVRAIIDLSFGLFIIIIIIIIIIIVITDIQNVCVCVCV